MLSGKQSIDGQVKLHSYLITVRPLEQQSGPKETGPKNKMERQSHQTVCTSMVKINQAQTPVGSIQGGVPLSRVNSNPDYDDDGVDD